MNFDSIQFSAEELSRYNRHIILPQFGMEGQKRLKRAKMLVIGSGGLGSPALLYLAAAGVGTLGIVDFDVVDNSNLQRQILFGINNIGASKAQTAAEKLKELNPNVEVIVFNTRIDASNAMEILKDFDVVIDGSDNFATRYLINDACVLLKKPLVYGSVFRFDGQVSLFNFKIGQDSYGPNYRDLYPVPPQPGEVLSCTEGGVLGVLPGIIGSMQALEAIKVVSGIGETLSGRLLIFDALTFETKVFKISASEDNPLTGQNPAITKLVDYDAFCGIAQQGGEKEITPQELQQWIEAGTDFQLIDVREPDEYELVNIKGELIPLSRLQESVYAISKNKKVVVHCKLGGRSAEAIKILERDFGFTNLYNLKGGIIGYIDAVNPELDRY